MSHPLRNENFNSQQNLLQHPDRALNPHDQHTDAEKIERNSMDELIAGLQEKHSKMHGGGQPAQVTIFTASQLLLFSLNQYLNLQTVQFFICIARIDKTFCDVVGVALSCFKQ